jgi:hypothetical protein
MSTQPTLKPGPHDDLVARMASLSDREFIEVFYAAVARRRPPGLDDWQAHWVLAQAEKIGRSPWTLDYIGPAREDVDDPGRVLCRETTCPRCRNPVRSWTRIAGCPICRRTVYCT